MNIPRPAERRSAGALSSVLVAIAVCTLHGCASKESPGVYLEFRAENPQYRPDAIRFTWMRAGAELVNERLPKEGSFTSPGPVMGSIFIETDGPLTEPRLIAVKGLRGDTQSLTGELVSGAVAVVPVSAEPVQRWAVMLTEPLADENGDGKPDVVQRCLREGWTTCLESMPPPGPGPTDAGPGGGSDASGAPGADGGAPGPDSGSPADAGGSLENGLIAHWRLDEGMGTQARDSSGGNNHGTLRNLQSSAWMPGKAGTGLEIPATPGSFVLVPRTDSLDSLRGAFTVAAWTFRMSHRQGYSTILSRRFTGTGSEHYLIGFQNGNVKALVNTYLPDGSEATLTGPEQAPLFTWVHVALTFDGTTLRLYQGAQMVASAAYTMPQMPDTSPVCLGCNQNMGETGGDETLAGRMDEVMIYNRALSPGELARLVGGELPAPK